MTKVKVPYPKGALTFEEQLSQLQKRGLQVENPDKALYLLQNLSYYRLSGYWYPSLKDKEEHLFQDGSTFDQAFRRYCFDRELRNLVASELEKIEVALRASVTYHYAHEYGPFWYVNSQLFINPVDHAQFILGLKDCFTKSKEEFIVSYKKKYEETLPPSWMALEIISFGTLSKLYTNLRPGKTKRLISTQFGLSDVILESWLHSLTYLRNICAHHSRLWNRTMKVQPAIPTSTKLTWLTNYGPGVNTRTYSFLSILLYFHQTINPQSSFKCKLDALHQKYPEIERAALGFPENWGEESLWK